MSKILNRSTLLHHWKNHGVLPAMRLLITEENGIPFNGLTWMVDLILKTLRFRTALFVKSLCCYFPPVESWYGQLIPSPSLSGWSDSWASWFSLGSRLAPLSDCSFMVDFATWLVASHWNQGSPCKVIKKPGKKRAWRNYFRSCKILPSENWWSCSLRRRRIKW